MEEPVGQESAEEGDDGREREKNLTVFFFMISKFVDALVRAEGHICFLLIVDKCDRCV